jgi:hypothetical protein
LGIEIIRDWKPLWIDGELPAGRPAANLVLGEFACGVWDLNLSGAVRISSACG